MYKKNLQYYRWLSCSQLKCNYVMSETCIVYVSWNEGVCICMQEQHKKGECTVCRLCTTGLRCRTRVMVFTTSFHHLSPNNTWNSLNYISLAILCKIFTFSLPRGSFCAVSCLNTDTKLHTPLPAQSILTPSLRLFVFFLFFFVRRRYVKEWQGRVLNVSILAWKLYVIL